MIPSSEHESILGERSQRAGGYYSLPLVFMLAIMAAVMGMSLGGIFGAGAAYWREQAKGTE